MELVSPTEQRLTTLLCVYTHLGCGADSTSDVWCKMRPGLRHSPSTLTGSLQLLSRYLTNL